MLRITEMLEDVKTITLKLDGKLVGTCISHLEEQCLDFFRSISYRLNSIKFWVFSLYHSNSLSTSPECRGKKNQDGKQL